MHIGGEQVNLFREILVPAAKNMFNFKRLKLLHNPPKDIFVNQCTNTPGIKSKTFQTLSSPEFTPKRRIDENGARVTTLINKKTGKPVEAYVAMVENDDVPCERYCIMVRDKKGDIRIGEDNYRSVGNTYFHVNKEKKMVMPFIENKFINGKLYEQINSYMRAGGNKEFGGIGMRLHQIRVERMLQESLGNVFIVAEGNSFPFHYDMGFRLAPQFEEYNNVNLLRQLKALSSFNGKLPHENAKYVEVCSTRDGKQVINISHTLENCLYDYYKKGGKKLDFSPNMYLDEVSVQQWIELIKKQPILF